MVIAGRQISNKFPPFIVAEMSGNHNQSLDRAFDIVEAAANAGVHAIKLQTYTPDTMTLESDKEDFLISDESSLWKGRLLYDLYKEAHTPWEWHEPIFKRAKELGLMVFSTPFDSSAVDFLEDLDVPCYKIASFENADIPLIRKVAETGKPVILSTGMLSIIELSKVMKVIRDYGCNDIVLLKCTSAYPAAPKNTNIVTIPHMRELFNCEVGLSDHTRGLGASIASVALGATMIEKHFTLNRSEGGVDAVFSLEPKEMKSLVEETKCAWEALGQITYTPTRSERASMKFRRSLYITQNLKAQDILTKDNVRAIRPGYGLEPKYLDVVLGKKIKHDVEKGTALGWELVESSNNHNLIPYGHQSIDEKDVASVCSTLCSEYLTTGPKIKEFEKAVCSYVGMKHGVAVSSGTAALHCAMYALDIGENDEVIVPAITFAATANSVCFMGATPVFVDVEPDTLLIDLEKVEALINSKTRAIIGVDYAGQPCDWDRLRALANKYNIALVADACHAIGAEYKNCKVGTLADMTVFSFHPVKNMTTGEGGMIVTDNEEYAQRMYMFRNHGMTSDIGQKVNNKTLFYGMIDLGYNYRITDIQCALGISQLQKLPDWIKRRKKIAYMYDKFFADVKSVKPLTIQHHIQHAYHLYVVRIQNRDEVFFKMRDNGIGVNVHYMPVYLHPYYKQKFGYKNGLCPVSENVYSKILSLPIWSGMKESDILFIKNCLKKLTMNHASME